MIAYVIKGDSLWPKVSARLTHFPNAIGCKALARYSLRSPTCSQDVMRTVPCPPVICPKESCACFPAVTQTAIHRHGY